MFFTLAWRNTWRNKRRSLITVLSITFAVLLACVMRSLQIGSYERMIDNSVRFYTGYIQIHKNGYWDDKVIDNSFKYDTSLQRTVTTMHGVKLDVPRLESFALTSFRSQTKGAMVMGVDPQRENKLTNVKEKIVRGRFLQEDDEGILLGEGLAGYLKVQIGDTVTLLSQGFHGANAAGLFAVRGIIRFALPQQNNQLIYMSLPRAQWFYAAPELITSIALLIDKPAHTTRIVSLLKSKTDSNQIEIMGWRDLVPELVQSIELDNLSGKVMLWVLYLVIGFGMFGTFLMMAAERQYEFGVMLAVGMRRIRLQAVVFLEISLMTVLGVLLGITVSLPILTYFYYNPIRYDEEAAKAIESFGVEAIYPFSLDPVIFTNQAYAIFIMAIVLSAYPIWTIYKMKVVESMRP
ncbi:MAG: ABC transporter permease [Cyclobacteriaceae bacterium]|nr:ABC transporter permease [Cyclobacteriaceae bacterium]MDH4297392.1 ABC transporter permease [Cyclobacteriaceae bacterium]MDH5248557.1 ABC transporter permease [Cyclobacteriaceae bacterium]